MESAIAHLLARGDSGLIEGEEHFWTEFAAAIGASTVVDELREDAWWWDEIDRDLVAFIAAARPRVRTGIISNAGRGVRQMIHRRYGLCQHFDAIVISGEEGCMKPEERIYRIACERLAVLPRESVFIDDVESNVEAARALGMEVIFHHSASETIARLTELLP